MNLSERWNKILEELRQQDRYRTLTAPTGIDFTSNDYLGYGAGQFAWRHRLQLGGAHATSGTASRLLRGHLPIWEQVESALARWHGAEAALMMTSGYAANEGLLSTIIEPGDWVASDQSNHASIIDGLRLARAERFVFSHSDLDMLESGLRAAAQARSRDRQLFIVTESLFSMEGDVAHLRPLAELATRYSAHLIVDEAHATGCLGTGGSGLVNAMGIRSQVLATVHTGGKALGLTGAYICGSRQLKELLINRCRHLIFTTALPELIATWWLSALPYLDQDDAGRALLRRNTNLFRRELAKLGIVARGEFYIVPLVLGSDHLATRAAVRLQEQGFDIRAIRPPTVPPGTSRLRIAIHADHERDTLQRLAEALASTVQTPSA